MKVVTNIFSSSLGRKYIMAVSGGVLLLFVAGHLAGNLQVFLGAEAINRYGHFLQSNVELIWPARITLLAMVAMHIWSAAQITRENRAARPVPYADWSPTAASYASRTMLVSGLIVAAFILYHLLHYTVLVKSVNLTGRDFAARPEFYDAEGRHDIFKMLVVGFRNPWVSLFYLLGIGLLCLHLSHGVSAMFQSLGLKNKIYGPSLDRFARAIAVLFFLGYASIPAAILLGFGKEALK
jgi:succinate dehydrogenase / fumarate reductase, cytochrome b subunit